MKRNTRAAFLWIVGIMHKNNVPFQIDGGLAARIYGSKRKLADIDIDISNKKFKIILPQIRPYIIFGPARYVDKSWDVHLVTLKYLGQKIDISGWETEKFYDRKHKKWVRCHINFRRAAIKKDYGRAVPVIPKKDLIIEKSELLRGVDKKDLEFLKNKKPSRKMNQDSS